MRKGKKLLSFALVLTMLVALLASFPGVSAATGYTSTDVMVPNGDYKVPATMVVPDGDGPFPLVVIHHGFAGDRHENDGFKAVAAALAAKGIASIRMDFIGSGDSEVDFVEFSLQSSISDSKACLEYALKNAPIDAEKLGILGYSNGGRIAMLITEADDNPYIARGLLAPATFDSASSEKASVEANLATALEDGHVVLPWYGRDLHVGAGYYQDCLDSLAVMDALKPGMDTIIVCGENDYIREQSLILKDKIGAPLVTVPGADHGYGFYGGDDDAMELVANTFADYYADLLIDEVEDPGYTSTDVMVPNDGRNVPATLVVPDGDGPFPLVVINHGFAGSRHENRGFPAIAEALAKVGIASIRMDFIGSGDSAEPFVKFSLKSSISDSNACLAYALKNAPIDAEKLGILGYSNGGRIAVMITEDASNPYKARGLLAPATFDSSSDEATTAAENLAIAQRDGYVDLPWYGTNLQVGVGYYQDCLDSHKVMDGLKKGIDTLIVCGDDDYIREQSLILKDKIGAPLVTVPNSDHGYGFYDDNDAAMNMVADTFAEYFLEALNADTTPGGGTGNPGTGDSVVIVVAAAGFMLAAAAAVVLWKKREAFVK